jgi:hypothetical protein
LENSHFGEIQENLLQQLSDFLSAFRFLKNPGKSIYGGKYTKDRYPSFVFPLLTM